MTAKYITEVLKELNDNVGLLNTTYKRTGDNGLLEILFRHAYIPASKFVLPSSNPPFKVNAAPLGMTPALFVQEIRKFNIFTRRDLNNTKRELLFIQTLENIHPTEAKILLAIKDQELYKLYPNLTHKVLADAGYIPAQVAAEVAENLAVVESIKQSVAPEITSEVTPEDIVKPTPKPRRTPAKPRTPKVVKVKPEVVEQDMVNIKTIEP